MKQRSIQNERAAFDQIFKAVGDPHRLKIIQLLAEQELNAGELLQSIDIVQSTLSHHMKCLVESGIVNARRNGKWTCYTLNPEVIHDAYDFLGQYLGGTKKTGTGGTAAEDTADSPDSSANSGQPSAPQDGEGPAKMKKKGSGVAEDEKKIPSVLIRCSRRTAIPLRMSRKSFRDGGLRMTMMTTRRKRHPAAGGIRSLEAREWTGKRQERSTQES